MMPVICRERIVQPLCNHHRNCQLLGLQLKPGERVWARGVWQDGVEGGEGIVELPTEHLRLVCAVLPSAAPEVVAFSYPAALCLPMVSFVPVW